MGTENLLQLQQLRTATWDGNLISKHARDELVTAGLVERAHGWNWITRKGIDVLHSLGGLKA